MPRPSDYDKLHKRPKIKSVWDPDIDQEKLAKLSPKERARLFPNDYNAGDVYGDC